MLNIDPSIIAPLSIQLFAIMDPLAANSPTICFDFPLKS